MPDQLSLNSVICASPDQVSSDLAGETVLLSMRTAKYYGFEGVGSRIWDLVQTEVEVSAVCRVIAEEYAVDEAVAVSDTLGFLNQLYEKGLVEVRGGR